MRVNNGKQELTKVPRPYTPYNIFFQLEREYILQKVFQVIPCLVWSEIFDRDSKEYNGPLLPSRYSDLILHREWHVPGKGRRNKRSHRGKMPLGWILLYQQLSNGVELNLSLTFLSASHGKIGFKQLSQQIAKSWASVGSETREFCKKYAEDCKLQYKAIMTKKTPQTSKTSKSGDEEPERVISNPEVALLVKDRESLGSGKAPAVVQQTTGISKACRVPSKSESSIIHVGSTIFERKGLPEMQETPEELNGNMIDTLFSGLPFFVNDNTLVDMEDNTIIDMWHTFHRWGNTPSFW